LQDFSSSSAGRTDDFVENRGGEDSEGEAAAETGRRLWYQLIALAVIGTFSFSVLISQLVSTQTEARAVQAERDRAVVELGIAKQQLAATASELATAKANRAEQIIATDKDVRRIEGEVSALKTQRATLTAQVDDLVRRQQDAENRLATATQRRSEVESQLTALRSDLATVRTESKRKRHKTPQPPSDSTNTP